ncbi:MAG TPA: alpha/beta hydrolase [Gemmatimonadaceae bacterium]|jgi:pimeloyl-ACP methyl ester carboxylesterase|nr:alpha/beta hydrolase [Gemmatimonadaceae bacterium]
MRWSVARACVAIACALATVGPAALAAQETHYDSSVVSVRGNGPTTFVLISGMVGGVSGFRRLASLLESENRVVTIDPYRLAVDSADVTFAALARYVDTILGELGVDSARVVGHAHGTGVALRLAANSPDRVSALYFLDGGAVDENRTTLFASSLKWASFIMKFPGGRNFVRGRFIKGIKQNAGRRDWLDSATVRAYTEPVLSQMSKAISLAKRLDRAREPDSSEAVVERVRVPVTVLLGDVPHPAEPDSSEITALASLGDRVRIERLPGVGHFPHEESPADVAAYLLVGTVATEWRSQGPNPPRGRILPRQ